MGEMQLGPGEKSGMRGVLDLGGAHGGVVDTPLGFALSDSRYTFK